MNIVDKLITPMDLTDELLNTQCLIKLKSIRHYNIIHNCRLEEYDEQITYYCNILFDFETITSGATHQP